MINFSVTQSLVAQGIAFFSVPRTIIVVTRNVYYIQLKQEN